MIIGLTGTPGTGKTTIARFLEEKDVRIVYIKELAESHDFIESYDETRKSSIIDVDAVDKYLNSSFSSDEQVIIESHLAHLLSIVDQVMVLRCHPQTLRNRLLKRNWTWQKIRENLEAEMLDVILCEAVDEHGIKKVSEIDTTLLPVEEIAGDVYQKLLGKETKYAVKPGSYDWSELLFDSSIMEEDLDGT